ncbi:pectate lyase [Stieleria sp. JC731]|uniref:pectate lyase n=1 Tax=Pirellulaceae TaxID=2691357 RepID=UPI001E5EA797|nr:pectate lyase [Stieleria sp. JC731]MCC9602152.1 pectate lyase [Stieleria sp. JC731]
MKYWHVLLAALSFLAVGDFWFAPPANGQTREQSVETRSSNSEEPSDRLVGAALDSAKRATSFLTDHVSTHGGYLWRYSADLQLKEGEGIVKGNTVWVQPPGTPSVGLALTHLYQATGDLQFRDAALAAAEALRLGQMHSGGWQASIEFDPDQRKKWAYRVEPPHRKRKDQSSLDDNKTQSALLFLITLDEALDFKNKGVHDTAVYGLKGLLENGQFKNGGFPQVWTDQKTSDHTAAAVPASYPSEWSRQYTGHHEYWYRYTLNDHLAADMMDVLFEAERVYKDQRFRDAALRLADSLLNAQMPEPQPAWAQQYNASMEPIWARKFEPPAITTSESFGVIETLIDVYQHTGEKKYLEPIPRALEYLKTCELDDGRVARFYELKTNRPLYFDLQYQLTYSDSNMPTHYGFQLSSKVDQLQRRYEKVLRTGPSQVSRSRKVDERELRRVIDSQSDNGIWLNQSGMRYHKNRDPAIDMAPVVANLEKIASYLQQTKQD